MDEREQTQELRNEVNQLKDQVSKMMEMLQSMEGRRNTDGNPSVPNEGHPAAPLRPPDFSPTSMQYQSFNPQGVVMPLTVYPNNTTQPSVAGYQGVQLPPFLPYGLPFGCAPPQTINSPGSNGFASNSLSTTQPHVHYSSIGGTPPLQHFVPTFMPQYPLNSSTENFQSREKWKTLEERLRAIEEASSYGLLDASELCLVPNVVIPPKFKVPDFNKYKGTTCPKNHLTMYIRKMASYANDDKLLIHFFQDSLTGAASNWYMHLKRAHIRCFKDLTDAFLKQYKYNIDMAPDRMQLQSMSKKDTETFKEYAQRWREIAAQVEPHLSEKEMVNMFTDTLHAPFYDHMIGNVSLNFSDIVIIGERIESGMTKGRLHQMNDEEDIELVKGGLQVE